MPQTVFTSVLGGGFPPGLGIADLDRLTPQLCIHCRREVDWWHTRQDAHCTACWDHEMRCTMRNAFDRYGLPTRAEGVRA